MTSRTVIVTGANGFLALTTIQALLKEGYTVVGVVRSDEKGKYTKESCGASNRFTYEVVKDIGAPNAFDEVVKKHPESIAFLHTASPVPDAFSFAPDPSLDTEKRFLLPAVNGINNVFSSIVTYGKNIRRVVLTSTSLAMSDMFSDNDASHSYDESSWSNITWEQALNSEFEGYCGCKKFAEKAAWDFVKTQKPNFSFASVAPSAVLGPQPTDTFDTTKMNLSCEIINSLLKLDSDAEIPPISGAAVDVRDVAKAHIVAIEKEEAKGERLLVSAGRFTSQTVLDIAHAKFPEATKSLPVGKPGSDVEELKTKATLNNERTRRILGFELIPLEVTIAESIEQILKVKGKI